MLLVLDPRRDLRRPRGVAAALLLLLSIWASRSESRDIRPSEHGVALEKDPGAASPEMVDFFRGRPEGELPEALNATDPAWAVASRLQPAVPSRSGVRARVALLVAGVVCGVVGVALLAAAAVAYVVHARRSKPGAEGGSVLSLTRPRSGPEVRLGGA